MKILIPNSSSSVPMVGAVFDLAIWRLSAKGSEFFRKAAGKVGPARGNVGDALKTINSSSNILGISKNL